MTHFGTFSAASAQAFNKIVRLPASAPLCTYRVLTVHLKVSVGKSILRIRGGYCVHWPPDDSRDPLLGTAYQA